MNVQDFGDKSRRMLVISNETVEGDQLNDNASVNQMESRTAVLEMAALVNVGDSGDDVTHKSQKVCSESIDHSGEVKESQPCDLQANPRESREGDINFGDKQFLDLSNGSGGNADCASQPIEIQKESLEDKSVVGSDAQTESKIRATISDESRSLKVDNAGENVSGDTKTQLLPEPKEIQDASELCEIGHFEVESGLCRPEDSGKESVCGLISKDNEICTPVLSVSDDSILERKECYQKPETEHGAEDLSEEATEKLLPEPDKNEDAITVACENGDFEVAHGLGSEEPGTQSVDVGESSVNENGNPVPVLCVNDSALEVQESYQHVDNSQKPFDPNPSSGISEGQIPAFRVPKPQTDLGGENDFEEDTGLKILPESDEIDSSIAEICENGSFEVDHGLGAEEPVSGSVNGPSFKEDEDRSSVLSANRSVAEGNKSIQHIDDRETSFEMHPSSSISGTPIVASSCLKPETGLTESPYQRIENAPDLDVFQGHEVDPQVSSCKEEVKDQIFENVKPENEKVDAFVVDTAIIVTDQSVQIEDSAVGDTEILESKPDSSVKVDDFSCSDTHSSIEELHDTKPDLGISYPEREMTTSHLDDSDFKNEILLANAESNDVSSVVLNTESDVKQEESSSSGIKNMSSSNDNNRPFEVKPSSSISNIPNVVSSCMKPENEDTDVVAVESVENGHYIAKDMSLEIKSSVPHTTTLTSIDQADQIEDSTGRDTKLSSPGEAASFEKKTNTSVKVVDFSCSNGHSPKKNIHETEPVIGEMDAFNGECLDSKNEITLPNGKSNDITTVVSNTPIVVSSSVKLETELMERLGQSIENDPDIDVDGQLLEDLKPESEDIDVLGFYSVVENGHDITRDGKLEIKSRVADTTITGIDLVAEIENAARNGLGMIRPFTFLVKIPKFDDTKIREQVRQAQLIVEEKTQLRDVFRFEIVKYRHNCHEHRSRYQAAMDESRSLKRVVKTKRAEIESLQNILNKVKNAQSVQEIDARIVSLEHMIEHETLSLSEEKQFIREIKQLKMLREQLSCSIGPRDEVEHATKDRDHIEARLKGLRKELESLKETVMKAEAVAQAVDRIYEVESKKMKEAQEQYKSADNVRQEAYVHMQNLKTDMYEKNQRFRMYKRDAAVAYDLAAKRETEPLHILCFYQVENVMHLWKNDTEFRKEYVTSNMRSTLRRLGTFDGRSLSPDEKPLFLSYPMLGGYDRPENPSYEPPPPPPEIPEILHQEVSPIVEVVILDKDSSKVKEEEEVVLKNIEAKKPMNEGKFHLGNGFEIITNDDVKEEKEERLPSKEEVELARKAEELRKEELKEQRRLEEKAKALEALERKKRIAEKAQSRAELRAQKEAEQKEKEREKRLRKKEKKKATDGDNLGENTIADKYERAIESIKEPEIKETSASTAVAKRSSKQNKNKSIPPAAIRNKGRKKLQQWILGIVTCVVVVFVFIVINIGFFSNISVNLKRPTV